MNGNGFAAAAAPLTPSGFGLRVPDFRLGACSDDDLARLRGLWLASGGLLVLTGGDLLAPGEFLRFCRAFGPLEDNAKYNPDFLLPDHPEILRLGNLRENGDGRLRSLFVRAEPGTVQWHTDDSFRVPQPAGSILHCRVNPGAGGGTWFAGMAHAWEALPAALREQAAGRYAVHSYAFLDDLLRRTNPHRPPLSAEVRRSHPPVVRPLVGPHPETGREALCIPDCHIRSVSGLTAAEGRTLLQQLVAHATCSDFAVCHPWRPGDLAVWDNRSAMHAASPFDESEDRLLHRVTFAGPDALDGDNGRSGGMRSAGRFGVPITE